MKPSIVSLLAGIAFSAVTSFALTNLASLVPSFPGTGADSQRDLGPMGRGLGKQVVRLYSSGVDDNGIVLPDGQPDPHYQLVEAPVGPLPLQPVTVDSSAWQFFVWVPNDAAGSTGSKWIARTADAGSTAGMIYVYRTTFTLPHGTNPKSVKIVGSWGADDTGEAILLNGEATGQSTPPFSLPGEGADVHPDPFVITSGFKGGLNTLDFVVTDGGLAVTAFRVYDIQLLPMDTPPPPSYSLTADFSTRHNPNGVWSYGWSETRGSAFQLDTVRGEDTQYGDLVGWVAPDFAAASLHIAYGVSSFYHPDYLVPLGTLYLHPGPNGQNTVIRWTAPAAGFYDLRGSLNGSTFSYQTSVDVAVLHGSEVLLSGQINGFYTGLPFDRVEQVEVGDTIDFSVGYGSDGSYSGDATTMSLTITPTAPVYDPALDFSASHNPNGVWTYGYSPTLGGTVILHSDTLNNNGVDQWFTELTSENNKVPALLHNPTDQEVALAPTYTPVLAPGVLAFHPGQHDEFSVLRFTAPSDGEYHLTGSFFGQDVIGTTSDVHILAQGASLLDATVAGYGPGTGPSFDLALALSAGDHLDFAVGFGDNGNYYFDSTGLDLQIRLITSPEDKRHR